MSYKRPCCTHSGSAHKSAQYPVSTAHQIAVRAEPLPRPPSISQRAADWRIDCSHTLGVLEARECFVKRSMCGIAVRLEAVKGGCGSVGHFPDVGDDLLFCALTETAARRGPDATSTHRAVIGGPCGHVVIDVSGSVLHLRGPEIQPQPIIDSRSGSFLLFNGEIYNTPHVAAIEPSVDLNDVNWLFNQLVSGMDVPRLHDRIEGPFAFVWYSAKERRLYYGRDTLGRRSLLCLRPREKNVNIVYFASAVAQDYSASMEVVDVVPGHVHMLDLSLPLDALSACDSTFRRCNSVERSFTTSTGTAERQTLLKTFQRELSASVQSRVLALHRKASSSGGAHVAVLFSGGVDCTTLALLAHSHIPAEETIDLINVAFGNFEDENRSNFDTPDRHTALSSLSELEVLCPTRSWRLLLVNVDQVESKLWRKRIYNLIRPNATVMDMSIATALWFAARGRGILSTGESYTSEARVLLSGLGADELLGGYQRHRSAWKAGGCSGLAKEMDRDFERLPYRNLGRDDRVMSDHGKEARYPFLAGNVVHLLRSANPELLCNFSLPVGHGEKYLLRALAEANGLRHASSAAKRALQFGSRSTCLQPKGQKGNDVARIHDF